MLMLRIAGTLFCISGASGILLCQFDCAEVSWRTTFRNSDASSALPELCRNPPQSLRHSPLKKQRWGRRPKFRHQPLVPPLTATSACDRVWTADSWSSYLTKKGTAVLVGGPEPRGLFTHVIVSRGPMGQSDKLY